MTDSQRVVTQATTNGRALEVDSSAIGGGVREGVLTFAQLGDGVCSGGSTQSSVVTSEAVKRDGTCASDDFKMSLVVDPSTDTPAEPTRKLAIA